MDYDSTALPTELLRHIYLGVKCIPYFWSCCQEYLYKEINLNRSANLTLFLNDIKYFFDIFI
jgi:hypothetical protein